MQRLIPHPDGASSPPEELDDDAVRALVAAEHRRHPHERPWVFTNMVTTVDGAAAVDGRSGPLGGPADRIVFGALRAQADVILVGAATVRTERYRLPREPPPELVARRRDAGQDERPRLCIVSRTGDVGDAPLLDELPDPHAPTAPPWQRPLLVTTRSGAASSARAAAHQGIEKVIAPTDDDVDLRWLIDELGARGARRILCEGGPLLLAQLAATGLVDEWNFTISPIVVAGDAVRPVRSAGALGVDVRLDRLLVDGSVLLARYLADAGTSHGITTPSPATPPG